jgi:hypothetical protein
LENRSHHVSLLHDAVHRQGQCERKSHPAPIKGVSADIFESQYAAVMGISKDLHLVGNNFSNVASFFFIAYLIAEVPNGS